MKMKSNWKTSKSIFAYVALLQTLFPVRHAPNRRQGATDGTSIGHACKGDCAMVVSFSTLHLTHEFKYEVKKI